MTMRVTRSNREKIARKMLSEMQRDPYLRTYKQCKAYCANKFGLYDDEADSVMRKIFYKLATKASQNEEAKQAKQTEKRIRQKGL